MAEHPITPPPELIDHWRKGWNPSGDLLHSEYIAIQAARWGADQELEACCEWLQGNDPYEHDYPQMLRSARRPPVVPETIEVDGHTYRLVK